MNAQGERMQRINMHLQAVKWDLVDLENIQPNDTQDAHRIILSCIVRDLFNAVNEIAEALQINAEM